MKKVAFIFIIGSLLSPTLYAQYAADLPENKIYWKDRQDGWFWYKDPPPEIKPEKEKAAKKDDRPPELLELEDFQKKMEVSLKTAIMNPSDENLKVYWGLQKEAAERATLFADKSQRLSWSDPDPRLRYGPTARQGNAAAVLAYDQRQFKNRRDIVAALKQTHGLFFFFRNNCPYCHAQAPILKRFEQTTGMTVFPVSMDGSTLLQYPNPRPDNGFSVSLGITTVPAIVLAVPSTKETQIIGLGVMSEEEIYQRIEVLTSVEPGARF